MPLADMTIRRQRQMCIRDRLITEPLRSGDAEKALQYRAEVEREYAAAVGMIECL